jgi:magnesium chelatase subunit D
MLPFTAVVGQEQAKLALVLAAVEPKLGGVLLRGDKGSAKTTLARGLAALLPGDAPFVELPLGAGEDRTLGTLDLQSLLRDGTPSFRPGLLAAADGGVLYVDEINLLADHLVDALLDVAVSGLNRVERDGVSHVHPARFVLVASMNPEEGELRPQLLDRFGLSVEVRAPEAVDDRVEAVRRQLATERGEGPAPDGELAALRTRIDAARRRPVHLDDEVLRVASTVVLAVGAEGLRGDLMLVRAASALAAWEGRSAVGVDDLRRVAPMVLAHRRRRRPFEQPGIDQAELDAAFDRAAPHGEGSPPAEGAGEVGDGPGDAGANPATPSHPAGSDHPAPHGLGRVGDPDDRELMGDAPPLRLPIGAGDRVDSVSSAHGRAVTAGGPRGRAVRPGDFDAELGVDPLGSAVALAARRAASASPDAPAEPGDLRSMLRQQPQGALVVFVVDASGSMGAAGRLELARSAAVALLADAYRRRCRVALVTFGGDGATTVLRPTSSVEVARARLADLHPGGASPIAEGLREAAMVITRAAPSGPVTVVLITDGRATAAGTSPAAASSDAAEAARELVRAGVAVVVVDSERGRTRLGRARELAERVGAVLVHLEELERFADGDGRGRDASGRAAEGHGQARFIGERWRTVR